MCSCVGSLFWPTFILALITAVIGSQAMVSCAFATMSHLQALNCFPRVKILRTSRHYSGQMYIPEVNIFLCISACMVTLIFRTTGFIARAHGKNSKLIYLNPYFDYSFNKCMFINIPKNDSLTMYLL